MVTDALLTLPRKYRCTKHIGTDENCTALRCSRAGPRETTHALPNPARPARCQQARTAPTNLHREGCQQASVLSWGQAEGAPAAPPRAGSGHTCAHPSPGRATRHPCMCHVARAPVVGGAADYAHGPRLSNNFRAPKYRFPSCSWQQQRRARQRTPVTVSKRGPAKRPAGVGWGRRKTSRVWSTDVHYCNNRGPVSKPPAKNTRELMHLHVIMRGAREGL